MMTTKYNDDSDNNDSDDNDCDDGDYDHHDDTQPRLEN